MLPPKSMLLALCAVVATCTGCGSMNKMFNKKKDEKPAEAAKEEAPKQDATIGLIEVVNPEQHFVLVRTESRMALVPGTKLITQPTTGNKATLIVTPESKQNFISADIVEGFPKRGDVVILPVAGQPTPMAAPNTPQGGGMATGASPTADSITPGVLPGQQGMVPSPGSAYGAPGHSAANPVAPLLPEEPRLRGPRPEAAPSPSPSPVSPAAKVPSVNVPGEKGTINAPVDPLPPPL